VIARPQSVNQTSAGRIRPALRPARELRARPLDWWDGMNVEERRPENDPSWRAPAETVPQRGLYFCGVAVMEMIGTFMPFR